MPVAELSRIDKLVSAGLSKYEALAYLALLEKNNTAALDIADRSGIPRQRIYDILNRLQAKGLCSAREGRPRRYAALQPEQALTAMLNYRKRQQAAENERQARLIKELIPSLNVVINREIGEPSSLFQNDENVNAHHDIGGL